MLSLIIDNGYFESKFGFANEKLPSCSIRPIIGKVKFYQCCMNENFIDTYFGGEALERKKFLNIRSLIENDMIIDWYAMESLWYHVMSKKLQIYPSDRSVLFTEKCLQPVKNREQIIQIFFESFSVPSLCIANQTQLSMLASGRTTGLVLDSSDSLTQIVAIHEGDLIKSSISQTQLAGQACTKFLSNILNELNYESLAKLDSEIFNIMKEKLCYVALNYEDQIKQYNESNTNNKPYTLPDGNIVVVKNQRIRCPEILFKPSLFDINLVGIHELTYQSIMKCDVNIQKILLDNIILSGGTTMFNGFSERFSKELASISPILSLVKVQANHDRKFNAWIGGSIASQLSSFKEKFITQEEYDENGPTIIHRKCI